MKSYRFVFVSFPIFIFYSTSFILKTLTVDLYKNLRLAFLYSFCPMERKKLRRELSVEKMVAVLEERVNTVERLLYSLFEDPEYHKSAKGKHDLQQLSKEVK